MKIIKYILIAFIAISVFASCFKERIELDLNDGNKKVVVTAWITDSDEDQYILVNYSGSYYNPTEIDHITDAEVLLKYDNEIIQFVHTVDGKYEAPENWRATIGTSYTLEINHKETTYTATAMMRYMPEVEDIKTLKTFEEDSLFLYEVYLSFAENSGEGDGYYGIDYKKNTLGGDTLSRGGFVNDDLIDGQYFKDIVLTVDGYNLGDTVILDVFSIGKEASLYLQDVISETFRQGLFDPPPVNVRSNFSSGAFGYFIASGTRRYEVVVQ